MLGKRLLVIEDDKDSLHAMCELLRRAEYEVLAAETGREGLRLLHGDRPPDLVVLDFWLPDMTGHALLSTRTRWPGAGQVPVLLVTGDQAWADEHTDLRQLGVVRLLRKPIVPNELLGAIEEVFTVAPALVSADAPVLLLKNDADTSVAVGAARPARRLSDLLARVSEVLAQGTDVQTQLRDVARAVVPAYATACVLERTDMEAAQREVLWTQHESAALEAELRAWACQPEWLGRVLTDVAETGKPRLLDLHAEADLLAVGGTRADVASARALGFESVVVVPMIARRRLFGMLTCAARASRRYVSSHVETFADLGHRVALALDNAELLAAAQQTVRDRDELLHALSTELQGPLSALLQAATGAQLNADPGAESGLADTIVLQTRRLQERLRELIDFGLLQAGRLPFHMQNLEFAALARRVADSARQNALQHSLSLRIDAEAAGLQAHCDPERTAQAVRALLQRALENTSPGGRVDVIVSRVEGDLQLSVADSGPALAPELRERLGGAAMYDEDYPPTPNAGQPALGLRLARALIDAQAGRFWVQPAEHGNLYHLSLPLQVGPAAELNGQAAPDAAILLVDSDLAFRRELKEILCERGYCVETSDNGLQAWQYLLGHQPPALILFDLALPAMDGWELHAAIKGHAALRSVPTVVVSGLDRYRIEASLPDANGYIEKPIRTAQLFEVVQRYVACPARPRTLSVRPGSCL